MISQDLPHYQVGGSLPPGTGCYVQRQADEDLYRALLRGEFCYVFSSRQMGKSSLRVQTMQRLRSAGVHCAAIDMAAIGQQVEPEQWYASIAAALVSSFGLAVNLGTWWRERSQLPFIHRLEAFLETVLLAQVAQDIVIFIDEIDSVLALGFSVEDFFALIRACYNKRSQCLAFKRLSFALLGVATSADLVSDPMRTPFNMGRAIELTGFQFSEAQPLIAGLAAYITNADEVLQHILAWTRGQPFLTQKLCQMVVSEIQAPSRAAEGVLPSATRSRIPSFITPLTLEYLFHTRVIDNWEAQDDPAHLRTIRDRMLSNENKTSELLGLYQQILLSPNQGTATNYPLFHHSLQGIPLDGSREQIDLLLSGLVEKNQGYLQVKTPIYAAVFNLDWIEQHLAQLRPYAALLTRWLKSGCTDESRLLRGQALLDAQAWSVGKNLSDQDYRFLAASQALERREVQRNLEADRAQEMVARLELERQSTRRQRLLLGLVSLGLFVAIAMGIVTFLQYRFAVRNEISAIASTSESLYTLGKRLDALIAALRAKDRLISLNIADPVTQQRIDRVLEQAIYGVVEANRLSGHASAVRCVSFSPDSAFIATCGDDTTVKLWRPDGSLVTTLKGHFSGVLAIAFSPDGSLIATAGGDQTIKLWSHDGWLVRSIPAHTAAIHGLAFSPDSQTIASGSVDQTMKLWNRDGQLLKTLKGHRGSVTSVTFSPDGTTLASSDTEGNIQLWNRDGTSRKTLKAHREVITQILFDPSGQQLVSTGLDDTLRFWKINGTLIKTVNASSDGVTNIAFSPDEQLIASVGLDKTLKLWQRDGTLLTTLRGHDNMIWGVSFSSDQKWIATASQDKTARLWRRDRSLLRQLEGHKGHVHQVDFSPDGQALVTTSQDKTVKFWTANGMLLKTIFPDDRSWMFDAKFSPDGHQVVLAGSAGTVQLRKRDGTLIRSLTERDQVIHSVAFSPKGDLIATGGRDRRVRLWRRDGTFVRAFTGHADPVWQVVFSPDGRMGASASADKTAKIWQIKDASLITSIVGHDADVRSLAFSPDGSAIATGSLDKTVKLWSVDGKLLQTFTGHHDGINHVVFSPNGEWIASGSADKTIKIWHRSGTLLRTLSGHADGIRRIAFSPDGELLASASFDKTAILWHLKHLMTLDSRTAACEWVQDYLATNADLEARDRHLCDDLKR